VSPSWGDQLLDAVGPRYTTALFTALANILPPDIGGDTALRRELVAARAALAGKP